MSRNSASVRSLHSKWSSSIDRKPRQAFLSTPRKAILRKETATKATRFGDVDASVIRASTQQKNPEFFSLAVEITKACALLARKGSFKEAFHQGRNGYIIGSSGGDAHYCKSTADLKGSRGVPSTLLRDHPAIDVALKAVKDSFPESIFSTAVKVDASWHNKQHACDNTTRADHYMVHVEFLVGTTTKHIRRGVQRTRLIFSMTKK